MSVRRLILAAGSGDGEPVGPLPPDPTLTEARHFGPTMGINQNVVTVPSGAGTTYRSVHPVVEDTASVALTYSGYSQGEITNPVVLKASIEYGETVYPLTFNGSDTGSLPFDGTVETDPVDLLMLAGSTYAVRVWVQGGQVINVNDTPAGGPASVMSGDHTAGTWAGSQTGSGGPVPIAAIGSCRPDVIVPAVLGDSIAAQGRDTQGWIRLAANATNRPALAYGRNAMRFTSPFPGGDSLRGATHLLVQYGVNDMSATPTVATMWAWALGCYDLMQTLNPGIRIWQSTPTPIVATSDQCATLAGQAPHGYTTARPPWLAFLRDGCPINPGTRAPLSPGATGSVLRCGDDGHPLEGIVDIAAAVENGGLAGDGKWRVDLGPLGGDGVHPSELGMFYMAGPVEEWMASLT